MRASQITVIVITILIAWAAAVTQKTPEDAFVETMNAVSNAGEGAKAYKTIFFGMSKDEIMKAGWVQAFIEPEERDLRQTYRVTYVTTDVGGVSYRISVSYVFDAAFRVSFHGLSQDIKNDWENLMGIMSMRYSNAVVFPFPDPILPNERGSHITNVTVFDDGTRQVEFSVFKYGNTGFMVATISHKALTDIETSRIIREYQRVIERDKEAKKKSAYDF